MKDPNQVESELDELRRRIEELEKKTVLPVVVPYVVPQPIYPQPIYPQLPFPQPLYPYVVTCGGGSYLPAPGTAVS